MRRPAASSGAFSGAFSRTFPGALFAALIALAPAAGATAGTKPVPVEQEAASAARQLSRQVGRKTPSGQLRRVWSKGRVLGFDFTALAPAMQKPGPAQAGLKKAYPRLMSDLYCRKGSSSRAFITRGGAVQLSTYTRKGRLIHAAKLTRCH